MLIFKNLNKVWIKDILGRISEYLHIHQHADIMFDEVEESFITTSNIGSESKNSLRRKRHVSFGFNGGLRHPYGDSLFYDSKRILNELKILAETSNIIASSLLQPPLPDNFNSIALHNQHSFSPPIYIHPLQLNLH